MLFRHEVNILRLDFFFSLATKKSFIYRVFVVNNPGVAVFRLTLQIPPKYPPTWAGFGVRRLKLKPTFEDVILSTSSNQQVAPAGLPRAWCNRKPCFMWAFTISANQSEGGGTIRAPSAVTVKLSL